MEKIFSLLHKAVAIDFNHYRSSTIQRQLQRRMTHYGENDIVRYAELLEKDSQEAVALAEELLLPVTEFFRHASTFDILDQKVFPSVAERMTNRTPVRIWVPGCSTGEEVYSLAIAFNEYCDRKHIGMYAQFFGTDIIDKNIETARAAVYRNKIAKQVSAGRLKRFFERTTEGYRIVKNLRDRCVFARHDATSDPPFPNIDLLSCRNVLIYFDQFYQGLALPMFHFSLRTGGFLLLGPSESLGYFEPYFAALDKKAKIFVKPEQGPRPSYQFGLVRNLVRSKSAMASCAPPAADRTVSSRVALRETINRILLERYAAPGVLIDDSYRMREVIGDTRRYLHVPSGEVNHKLSRAAREGIMSAVYVAVKEAGVSKNAVRKEHVTFRDNGALQTVDVVVTPVFDAASKAPLYLVLFEESAALAADELHSSPMSKTDQGRKSAVQGRMLRKELEETKRHLQALVEEKEEVNQELWAGNEEIQAVNEELQSMNEELEGAKEELESANEEMAVMNSELQKRNLDLSSSNERMRLALNAANAGTWDWDLTTDTHEWSPKLYSIFGIDPSVKPGFAPWLSIVHPEDVESAKNRIDDAIDSRTDLVNVYRVVLPDRSVRWIRSLGRALYDKDKPVRVLRLCIDISDIKRAEESLRENEEKYRLILQNTSDRIFNISPDGTFLFVNEAYARALEKEPGEIVGKTPRDLFPPNQAKERFLALQRVTASGQKERAEFKYMKSSGEPDYTESLLEPIFDPQGKLLSILGVARDVTERRQMEEEIQKAQKLESLGLLAGGIAHDFNNLLGGIFGNIDLALSETSKKIHDDYLLKALSTIDRARGLTRQLLTFAKGGAPIKNLERLSPFIQETVKFALSGSNVSCDFRIPDDLWVCEFDKSQIGQVIDNIVINGQQAMPEGGVLEISAENIRLGENQHAVLLQDAYVKISIKDYGIGMPKEILPKIFDPFFTTKSKGHGLGLATSYSIIKRHGGCIDCESEPGKGSAFTIYLPALPSNPWNISLEATVLTHKGEGTVLVMDDEEIIRDAVSAMLKSLGYHPLGVPNSREAIELFKNEVHENRRLAALILDLTIPGGPGGKETIPEIRKVDRDISVFVASGYADDPVMANPTEYGFTASICKPFTLSELAQLFEKHIA